jgi:ElaB/YqjD/DUF883 family membrane-anchored ribosome-binding protein
MEQNKPTNPELIPTVIIHCTVGEPRWSPGSSPNPADLRNRAAETASQLRDRATEAGAQLRDRASEAYDQTKQAVNQAYDKTAQAVSSTYDQAMTFGREHPGQLTLIAFGAGIGIGVLLASGGSRRRTTRYAEPAINALSEIALEFFRRR